jgi:16S rRNA (guanine527-N7)-methyltransferase
MNKDKFIEICEKNQIKLDKTKIELLENYHNNLLNWNSKINLISRKDEENIWSFHILHSISILRYFDFNDNSKIMDIGCGGGLPGIPIKILRPDLEMFLVDSIAKKMKATSDMAKATNLDNISSIRGRAEEMKFNFKFDYIIARAVSEISNILFWTKKHVTGKTKYVLLKGGNLKIEINNAKQRFKNINIIELPIKLEGFDYFYLENKKIIIIEFS